MPSVYIHEKNIVWLKVSETGMHKEASKEAKSGEKTGAA